MNNNLRFCWHVGNWIAGSARPGRYGDLADDLAALRDSGVRLIVTLCAEPLHIPAELGGHFEVLHEPVADGAPPDPAQLERIVSTLESARAGGTRSVVHCRGGVGRTATVLIPVLMRIEGLSLEEAAARLRSAGRFTQSMAQHEFLREWSDERGRRGK